MKFSDEWVLEHIHGGVLRLDLTCGSSLCHNDAGVTASIFFCRGDEEGFVLGHISYRATEYGPGILELLYSDNRKEWTTFIGDIVAGWDPEWRVTSTPLCRIGVRRKHRYGLVYHRVPSTHLLVVQHLARMWGAVEQLNPRPINARYVLGSACDLLRRLTARQYDEFSSLVQHMQ